MLTRFVLEKRFPVVIIIIDEKPAIYHVVDVVGEVKTSFETGRKLWKQQMTGSIQTLNANVIQSVRTFDMN